MLAALAWSGVATATILLVLDRTMGLRVEEATELVGLDRSEHEEPAYQFDEPGFGSYAGGVSTMISGPTPVVGGAPASRIHPADKGGTS